MIEEKRHKTSTQEEHRGKIGTIREISDRLRQGALGRDECRDFR